MVSKTQLVKFLIVSTLTGILGSGCSNKTERKIEREIQQAPQAQNVTELREETRELIQNDPKLTSIQRQKLKDLHEVSIQKMNVLKQDSIKAKEMLVRSMIQEKYDAKEVSAIKRELKEIELQKLEVVFESVDKANAILGRSSKHRKRALNEYMNLPQTNINSIE